MDGVSDAFPPSPPMSDGWPENPPTPEPGELGASDRALENVRKALEFDISMAEDINFPRYLARGTKGQCNMCHRTMTVLTEELAMEMRAKLGRDDVLRDIANKCLECMFAVARLEELYCTACGMLYNTAPTELTMPVDCHWEDDMFYWHEAKLCHQCAGRTDVFYFRYLMSCTECGALWLDPKRVHICSSD